MEELELVRVREPGTAFGNYIPGNMRDKAADPNWVCVGAVYGGKACGAALAELAHGEAYVRYIFIDPLARLCGLGTYLLRGLAGALRTEGAGAVKAMYSPDMLESGRQTLGILERAGFSRPEPVSTGFAIRLGDIEFPGSREAEGFDVRSKAELSNLDIIAYLAELRRGVLPPFADIFETGAPSEKLSTFCFRDGELAGVLLATEQDGGIFLNGIYVMERFRGYGVASALISTALSAALELYPPHTELSTSTISAVSLKMCHKLFGRDSILLKVTEFLSVLNF